MEKGKGILGALAVMAIAAGIFMFTGGTGNLSVAAANILKWVGIGCIGIGILVAVIVVVALVAAFKSSPVDEHQGTKNEINQAIASKDQEVTKLKSTISIGRMEMRKLQMRIDELNRKIDDCDRQSEQYLKDGKEDRARETLAKKQEYNKEKANLSEVYSNYQKNVDDAERRSSELQAEILDIRNRTNSAFSKLQDADYITNGHDDTINKLEEEAQYKDDYAKALKSLGK